jgi:hypothetical protein
MRPSSAHGCLACAAAALVLIVLAVASGGHWSGLFAKQPPHRPAGRPSQFRLPRYWVMSDANLARIRAAAPGLVPGLFAGPSTFVLVSRGTGARRGAAARAGAGAQRAARAGAGAQRDAPAQADAAAQAGAALPVALFTSYARFVRELRGRAIPPDVRAVAYDPELWQATPPDEQADPLRYMTLFARAAHRRHYLVILMPGRDLLLRTDGRCVKQQGETLDQAFIRCDLAASARYAQIFEIQCAPDEFDPAGLRRFVQASASRARAANPSAVLIATLSTQTGGRRVAAATLTGVERAISPFVDGIQLNVAPGATAVAVSFLRAVARLGR